MNQIEDSIKLTIPLGPSVNCMYSNAKKGRKSTEYYKQWQEIVFYQLLKDKKKYKIEGDEWLQVSYNFYMPIYNKDGSKKKVDTFNFEKATSDVLEKNIEGFKDHKIKKGFVEKHQCEESYVDIIIEEVKKV